MRFRASICALAILSITGGPISAEPWHVRGTDETAEVSAAAYPESATMLRRLIGAAVEAGNDSAARQALERLAAMGYALSPAGQEQLARLLDPAVRERFVANAATTGVARDDGAIPDSFGLVESVVQVRGLWVASSVTGQDLLVSRDGRNWRGLGLAGLASLSGLAVDRRRGLVWAASAVFEQTPRREGAFSGVVLVDPRRGRIVRRIAAPEGVVPSDMVLGLDGSLYASDPVNGGIWRINPGASRFTALVAPGVLRSPQGLAPSADGRHLYVSDYRAGIAVIELGDGSVERLAADGPMMLDGIDGLFREGNELIGVQNGTQPLRIVAIRLSPGGMRAEAMRILLTRPLGIGEPTTGEIRGGRLHYVANARWDLYGAGGALRADAGPDPTQVHSLPVSPR